MSDLEVVEAEGGVAIVQTKDSACLQHIEAHSTSPPSNLVEANSTSCVPAAFTVGFETFVIFGESCARD